MTWKDQTARAVRLALAAAALLAAGACNRQSADAEPADTGVTIGPENIAVVAVRKIETGPQISGSLQPDEQAVVRAEVAGAVLETYVEAGQRVRKGELLARLDDTALRDQALSAKSAVATAQNANEIAQRNLQRSEALIKVGAIADRDLENARNAAMAAQTQLDNAKAVYANAQKTLDRTRITAPFDGVISARNVSGGDYLSAGGAMFSIVNPATMRLEASVPANEMAEVQIGQPVRFEVTGYPGRSFTGHITRVNPTADPVTRQVAITARIPNAGNSLVGGLFAEGRVSTATRESPVIPLSAVNQHGVRPTVMGLRQGKATPVAVELGIRDNVAETVEIRDGLAAGDTILVGAARGISPGTPVKVSAPTDVKE
ncbi:MAG TPA: efflux RND transporter periplasmic adaptor subunit [Gemmatimonadaceae bacterium]|nr:efflux RND transporter periplasmic adaptor subunit [Gemmatimonadaceae bacterium]